VKTQVLATTL